MNKTIFIIPIVLMLLVISASTFLYIVSETEQVVITQFGKPKREVKEAGLYFKTPFIEQVNTFEKRILEWDGNPTEVPTQEKQYLEVDSFARWRIADPLKFFQRARFEDRAQALLDDIINGAVRNEVSSHLLIEIVRSSNRELALFGDFDSEVTQKEIRVGRDQVVARVLEKARPAALEYGMELVDIQFKRIDYIEKVRRAVYEKMIMERKQIAAKFRSEGEGEMMEIMGEKEKDEKQILSEAYKAAQEIMGEADAKAIKIYADAYENDEEFYSFLKTLESYEENLGKSSTIILSTDSEYLKYLKSPIAE
ncbi:MAG: protease modulator HflC [Planctomycetes bacterium]|nr:protease modulator HflC [Planctomycetota bacterium]